MAVVPNDENSGATRSHTTSSEVKENKHAKASDDFAEDLYKNYRLYHIPSLDRRRIKYADIEPHLGRIASLPGVEVMKVGESVQHRDINLVKIGRGSKRVMLWSQMHGDEATATRALFEMFDFLTADDQFNEYREEILRETTIYVIPMLNPDGAEIFERRNALSIDINRDALRQISPESKILKAVRDQYQPRFGFNLHDQSVYYNVPYTSKTASISFLAPTYNYEKEVNDVRGDAMKLIVSMNRMIRQFMPGHVGRYDDEFEPRAFGDNIQKWGTSTILIESGGLKDDPEKKQLVKMNFVAILFALGKISDGSYADESIEKYYDIPENDRQLFDLIIRNGEVIKHGVQYKMDIGIFIQEKIDEQTGVIYPTSVIDDLGDLSTFFGYEELDVTGCGISSGELLTDPIKSIDEATDEKIRVWHSRGVTAIKLTQMPIEVRMSEVDIYLCPATQERLPEIDLGGNGPILITKGGKIKYVIINGEIKYKDN